MSALTELMELAAKKPIDAWHVSPFKFDKFDISKTGAGVGQNTYGRGLYFGGDQRAIDEYLKMFSDSTIRTPAGKTYKFEPWDADPSEDLLKEAEAHLKGVKLKKPSTDKDLAVPDHIDLDNLSKPELALYDMLYGGDFLKGKLDPGAGKEARLFRQQRNDLVDALIGAGFGKAEPNLYKARLHVDPNRLLDWNSGQNKSVLQRLRRVPEADTSGTGRSIYNSMFHRTLAPGAADASSLLNSAGIPGVRYLHGGHGDNPYNYVMFDDKPIEILKRYAQGGHVAGLPRLP